MILGGMKILPHAVFEVDRLADVDNLPTVLHLIDARAFGQLGELEFQCLVHDACSFMIA